MTSEFDRSDYEEAFHVGEEAASSLVDRIASRLTRNATAEAVFGEPIERDGTTIVPVAKMRLFFGGGEGGTNRSGNEEDGDSSEAGGGGGGGLMASPLGYIEVRDGHAEFHRTRDFASYWPMLLAGGVTAWLVLRGLRALFR